MKRKIQLGGREVFPPALLRDPLDFFPPRALVVKGGVFCPKGPTFETALGIKPRKMGMWVSLCQKLSRNNILQ
jgi:hypothetical protein